ncbi:MAG TPA: lysyl endopeptidase precursor, partial [Flavobacteriales bacterium]|nr:lysyl endopeptidase precursor [Flavobacteriales bacterium]
NNTANDGTPYFLTANHCLGNPNTWTYYFNHESSTCSGSSGPTSMSISGGNLLVADGGADVALIELSSAP